MAINSLTPTSHGFSGLASGMDTQSMVQKMLAGTQTKIDMKTQQKAVLAMKQGMYRDVAAQLKAFQTTFFSFTNPDTHLLSNSFFKTMNAATTSAFYKAQATSDATAGNITINSIKQLATNHKEVAANTATGALAGKVDAEALKKLTDEYVTAGKNTLDITTNVGGKAKTIKIEISAIAGKSTGEVADTIRGLMSVQGAGEKEGVHVQFTNGKISIQTDDKSAVTITGTEKSLSMVENSVSADGTLSFGFNSKAALPKIEVTVDGITKNISFNPFMEEAGKGTVAADIKNIAAQLNTNMKAAFGASVSVEEAGEKITFKSSNPSSKVTLVGEHLVMDAIGIKSGLSNKIVRGSAIGNINFASPLSGNVQKFSINGVDFSFDNSNSLNSIIDEINQSAAGVKINYDANTDKFSMESTVQGDIGVAAGTSAFKITQTEGNLMSSLFGVGSSGNYTSANLTKTMNPTVDYDKAAVIDFKGGDVSINVGGSVKTYTLGAHTTKESLVTELNSKLAADFFSETPGKNEGDPAIKTPSIQFEASADGKTLTLNSKVQTASVVGEGLNVLGYTEKIDANTKMGDLGFKDFTYEVGGISVKVAENSTLGDFINSINSELGAGNGTATLKTIGSTPFIELAGVKIPMVFPVGPASKLFGENVQIADTNGARFDQTQTVLGQNAKITVNGVELERSSNNFTIEGVNITLTGTTAAASDISVSQDTTKIFDTVKKFTEEYNKLVNSINDLLGSDTTYKAYPPLTAAQKAEMSDKEIEIWEEKSKGGLLRGDSTLQGVLNSLRGTLYTKPEGGVALYDLGITTDYFGTKDNLVIANEADLKKKIAENPDGIRKLFTDAEKGLATMMNTAIDKAAKASSIDPGSLVSMAGAKGVPNSDSTIARQMKLIDDSLSNLNSKYKSEYDRYWKQFNNMEQMIQKMNSQSSWLSQQFSS
ncbi:MAG: flagellar filament capping protein FliD [Oscillospiraceae bacterium]